MTYTKQEPASLALELELSPSPDDQPAWRGVATLLRIAAGRWGPCRRLDLKRHALELCEAAGFPDASERVEATLDLLVVLRDLDIAGVKPSPAEDEPSQEGTPPATPAGRYLIPARPRHVICGERAFFCGAHDALHDLCGEVLSPSGPGAVVRWVQALENEEESLLERGVERWDLDDWLGVPQHRRVLRRWARAEARESLPDLWITMDQALEVLGTPLGPGERCWALCGAPGSFYGAPGEGGRWIEAAEAPDGRWCAARPGYKEHHKLPGVAWVQGGIVKMWLQLYDWEELRWVSLARARSLGPEERFQREGDEIQISCSLPAQLRQLGALSWGSAWCWRYPPGVALRIARALIERGGLREG